MLSMLKGLGLGAGMMYLLDPNHGENRRGMIGEQVAGVAQEVTEWFDEAVRDPGSHATGLIAAAAGGLIGITLLSRKPLTALTLGALGLTMLKQSRSLGEGSRRGSLYLPGNYSGPAGSEGSRSYDPSELAHYGAGGAGHSGGRPQSGMGASSGTSS